MTAEFTKVQQKSGSITITYKYKTACYVNIQISSTQIADRNKNVKPNKCCLKHDTTSLLLSHIFHTLCWKIFDFDYN